jgi:FkbH-like protein
LRRRLAGRGAFRIVDAADLFDRYAVADPFDRRAERAAHVPYTEEAFAALAAAILRWRAPALGPPVKLIAVDGDMTLWDGVLSEDGPEGVGLSPGRKSLQERLAAAAAAGRIVALLSKNEDEDVVALMTSRGDFPLKLEHILARRVDWRPKAENLGELAAEFGVADESIVFLDDNPVECAQMRAARPGVLTVAVPEAARLSAFLDHLWPLDRPALTAADVERAASYRAEAGRSRARDEAPSLAEFFRTLDLKIDVVEAEPRHFQRLAQMTARTNQFNATLKRLEERDLAQRLARRGAALYAVSARDRFGDYGIVGCMGGAAQGEELRVDLFMLSCRALGRGVEHEMTATLGRRAQSLGLPRLAFEHVEGPRNAPARKFLGLVAGAPLAGDGVVRIDAGAAAAIRFDAATAAAPEIDDGAGAETGAPAAARAGPAIDRGAAYERLAGELASGAAIVASLRAAFRPRPELVDAFIAPAPGLECDIARIWEEALGVRPVGVHDSLRDLGGKSIHLVRIHGLLAERLGVEIELATLFRFGTVALLARHLADAAADRVGGAGARAERMRAARGAMAAARRGLVKGRAS